MSFCIGVTSHLQNQFNRFFGKGQYLNANKFKKVEIILLYAYNFFL